MDKMLALLLTLLIGCFFLVGPIFNKIFKDAKKLIAFVLGMSIVVTFGLIVLDLLPECFHLLEDNSNKYLIVIGFMLFGLIVLKVLDLVIPHHTHEHEDDEKNISEHHSHIEHIGILTTIPILIHNILEGMMVYNAALIDIKTAILFALSIAMHNIPLSMQITASLKDNNKKILIIILLILSTPVGGLLMFGLINNINNFVFGCLLAFTVGMLIYIIIFELLREIIHNSNKKYALLGIGFGIMFMLLHFIGHDYHPRVH